MNGLAANAEPLQNCFVTIGIRVAQVGQKPAPLSHKRQQALTGAVILLVHVEVGLKQLKTLAQQGNLYFWRPSVGFVALIR